MGIRLCTPGATDIDDVVRVLGEWQDDGAAFQLHPGDVGWFGWHGDAITAAALRTWVRDDRLVAIGLLDGPGLLRVTVAPEAHRDTALATEMAADISHEDGRVLPSGAADLEAPSTSLLREVLTARGWSKGDPWTHLRRDLDEPVDLPPGLRIEVTDSRNVHARTAVHRAAFGSDRFTDERWQAVAAGPAYRRARCLVGFDGGEAVAGVTVWSAGEGRPGIVEPMGVHQDHRRRGHGVAITTAAAAALRDLGASSALVGTPSVNVAAVDAYSAAGFDAAAEVADLHRAEPG